MSRIAMFCGLAMTAVVCPSGDATPLPHRDTDALHLMLIVHSISVSDGVPRLPGTGCPQFSNPK